MEGILSASGAKINSNEEKTRGSENNENQWKTHCNTNFLDFWAKSKSNHYSYKASHFSDLPHTIFEIPEGHVL